MRFTAFRFSSTPPFLWVATLPLVYESNQIDCVDSFEESTIMYYAREARRVFNSCPQPTMAAAR